jgi:ATP-dependent Clp protease adaptor protein ClpS
MRRPVSRRESRALECPLASDYIAKLADWRGRSRKRACMSTTPRVRRFSAHRFSDRLRSAFARDVFEGSAMTKTIVAPRTKTKTKTQRPPLYKVILLNDDYTPREFVVLVLKAVFRMSGDQAYRVMMTAHQRGACVIAVYTRDVAETKAKEGTELGKSKGYPLFFTTEPEQ